MNNTRQARSERVRREVQRYKALLKATALTRELL